MIKTATTNVAGPMDKAEAQAITDRIRNAVDSLGALVEKAHDRRAWKALGYKTWEAYVSAEFGFTRQRSYQLLDQGRVAKALGEAAGDLSNAFDISARDAAAVKGDLPAVSAAIKERIEAGEEPKAAVEDVVKEKREQKAAKPSVPAAALEQSATPAPKPKPASEPQADDERDDRIAELEAAVASLEKENAALKARIKEDAELERMRKDWREGGFEQVIETLKAQHDQVVRAQASRIERESTDKVGYMRSADAWKKRAEEAGWSDRVSIDMRTGQEVAHG